MGLHSSWETVDPQRRRRLTIVALVALTVFVLLLMRLWYLQVIRYESYRTLSEKNRIRYLSIIAPRGGIFDRDGRLLVDNRPSFTIAALRKELTEPDLVLDRLAKLSEVDSQLLQSRWKAGRSYPPYRPIPLLDDVQRDVLDKVQEQGLELPGIITVTKPMRYYPHGEMAAHLFGYIGEVNEAELSAEEDIDDYRPGDLIGKSGLEKLFETNLRGVDGQKLLEVDVRGKELRILQTREPLTGGKIELTIDSSLQQTAEEAFGEQAGAAVVIDVRTGELLAMVNRPAFDPAQFARGISGDEWMDLLNNPRHPLQIKAIAGQYPPGSTFKIVTALAALKAGVANTHTSVDCTGSIEVGGREFRCWKKKGHGHTDLKKALRESCDVWFYQVALEVGIDQIAKMARSLGLGARLNVLLDGEKSGLIPDMEWKKRRYNERWYNGETVIASIGQGFVLATPLQLAVMTAAVANGGDVWVPRLIQRVEDREGEVVQEMTPELLNHAELSPEDLSAVRNALVAVVNENHGTGWATRLKEVTVAGKTGTSQVIRRKSDEEEEQDPGDETPYRFRDHALFVSYAPADNPEIAISVVVEHGRHGSSAAAPIARAIYENYFGLEKEQPETPAEAIGD
ncbi:MAG: penicillin-binding protein 2 [Desulfuromonas sp.]|nr:MAG: penicillin-binding protein 2 [Desulfuromonas sp.]